MTIKFSTSAVALSAIMLMATDVSASTLTVSTQGSHIYFDAHDENPLFARTQYNVGDQAVTEITAGAFRVTGTDINGISNDFLAFCLQPLEGLDLPRVHAIANNFSDAITGRLNILAENALDLVTSHETAAAFQMAAWEITTEIANNAYDIDEGLFRITSDLEKSNAAEGIAQGWLDSIETGFWGPATKSYMILSADGTQDLLTNVQIGTVPLPAPGLMLLVSILGAGSLSARRRRKI
jgi:hypothetical protein